MEPLGTSFQSATADRNGARIAITKEAGKTHSRQKSRSRWFIGDWTGSESRLFNEMQVNRQRARRKRNAAMPC
jgi:hypothetical protein